MGGLAHKRVLAFTVHYDGATGDLGAMHGICIEWHVNFFTKISTQALAGQKGKNSEISMWLFFQIFALVFWNFWTFNGPKFIFLHSFSPVSYTHLTLPTIYSV